MSEPSTRDAIIREAASLVVLDGSGREPRVLMGKRLDAQVFLPGKWVFPGGRVEASDREQARESYHGAQRMAEGIRPFAIAAVRELFEETGLAAGRIDGARFVPEPRGLRPLARAITPPGWPRRFDTWFFLVDRAGVAETGGAGDGEFCALDWFSVEAARRLDLPAITRLVLEDVANGVQAGRWPANGPTAVPFYRHDGVGFRCDPISCVEATVADTKWED